MQIPLTRLCSTVQIYLSSLVFCLSYLNSHVPSPSLAFPFFLSPPLIQKSVGTKKRQIRHFNEIKITVGVDDPPNLGVSMTVKITGSHFDDAKESKPIGGMLEHESRNMNEKRATRRRS